jgi:hypothetical protein
LPNWQSMLFPVWADSAARIPNCRVLKRFGRRGGRAFRSGTPVASVCVRQSTTDRNDCRTRPGRSTWTGQCRNQPIPISKLPIHPCIEEVRKWFRTEDYCSRRLDVARR